jgi:Reverse transcriptase (RNA-dependent DNA polymerase)
MASSTSSSVTKTVVILDTPTDWHEWLFFVEKKAHEANIAEHINISTETGPTALKEPTRPSYQDVKEGATKLTELGPVELSMYNILRDEYKTDLSSYEKKRKALIELVDLILSTISRQNLTYVLDKKTPWEMLTALKLRVAPTDRVRKLELIRQYQELKKAPRSQYIDGWLLKWEKTYTEAEKLALPDVQDDRATYDFLLAVKSIDSVYAATHEVLLNEKLKTKEKLPTVHEAIADFRNHLRLNRAADKSYSHSAFATYNGEAQNQPKEQQNSMPGAWSKPCLCDEIHRFSKCPYLVEKARKIGWIANPTIQQKIDEKLATDQPIREAVERAREYARNPSKFHKGAQNRSPQTKKKDENVKPSNLEENSLSTHGGFAVGQLTYKLQNCWTLDSAADIHVCNNSSRFKFERAAGEKELLFAGKEAYEIQAYGTVDLAVKTPQGTAKITLLNVAFVPGFLTNLVALRRFTEKGVHWDTQKRHLHQNGKTFCYVDSVDDHWVLEKHPISPSSAFAASTAPRPIYAASESTWHAVLGHPGPQALSHLENASTGAKITEKGTELAKCEPCRLSKAHKMISRRPEKEDPAESPLARISYDLISLNEAYNGDKWVSHFTCNYTTMDFVYTHSSKGDAVSIIREFLNMAQNRYGHKIRYFRTDGERALGHKFDDLMTVHGITTERSTPDTPAQNGAAERSGGVIITKARSMRIAASLPSDLWPEIVKTAGYLNNRTPKRQLDWKTPFEALTKQKPCLSHLHVYGCRAYALDKHIPRKEKLWPRAHIGYLMGYESTNVYRIWVPSQEQVIRTRDVTFNETLFYDSSELDLGHILLDKTVRLLEMLELPDSMSEHSENAVEEAVDNPTPISDVVDTISSAETQKNSSISKSADVEKLYTPDSSNPIQLRTPEPTPPPSHAPHDEPPIPVEGSASITKLPTVNTTPTAEFDTQNILPEGSKRTRKSTRKSAYATALTRTTELEAFHSAFTTGLLSSTQKSSRHRDTMPTEPHTWKQMLDHPYSEEFHQAAKAEIQGLENRGTFKYVQKSSISAPKIPLLWVFKYKFDSNGFLVKFKARICVRGDLQYTEQDTYAATLAARTFRALISVTAAFDLEIRQYDAVNAFTNSTLNEEIYCQAPEGFERVGYCWLLLRALYGLKQSPLLWYTDFTEAIEELGLRVVPSVNCLMTNEFLTLFFYVDDIVIICAKHNLSALRVFEKALFQRFEMRSLGELSWFLGIRVIRDRPARKIWLCQDSYIEKVATRFNLATNSSSTAPYTPISTSELLPNEGTATAQQIYAYQQRVGSLNFASVISRPDISFTVSKLSQFLRNPSSIHLKAANRAISYLYRTRTYAIEFSGHPGSDIFVCSSDASFADDPTNRRSSDGYLFQLYGGAIDWRAARQKTVTTSSTEAELLSLSYAAKEVMWWSRFFTAIRFNTEEEVSIACDNRQTILLLQKKAPKLNTKLRHVDIHQHWLRQEAQANRIKLRWIPSADMPADGLTKALTEQKHVAFLKQLNLIDISKSALVPE